MASRDGGEAMGFHVVIDKDDLREGVQLTVDVNWSLEDATLMIKGAVCKTVRCHLFFVQRRTGAGAGNLELQNDKQGVDAIDFQKLLASQRAVSEDASGLSQSNQLSSNSRLRQGSSPQDRTTCRRCQA